MRLALMQPYFLPYLGYWQLMSASSKFLVYDKVEYSSGGWINRNRAFDDEIFTIPLKKHRNSAEIRSIEISDKWPAERDKTLRKIRQFYAGAKNFYFAYPLIEDIFLYKDNMLKHFLGHSMQRIKKYLKITTELQWASETFITPGLKGKERVLAYCEKNRAETYVNAPGGKVLYKKEDFKAIGVDLKFIESEKFTYNRKGHPEIFGLSILDVLMFNHREEVINFIGRYELI